MENKAHAEERSHKFKKGHPFESGGILSGLFYCWMLPLFYDGMQQDLTEANLPPPLKAHDSEILGDKLEESWKYEMSSKKQPSLWRALWRIFWKDFIFTGIIWIFVETIIKGSQPLCMSKLLDYYRPGSTMDVNEAYIYAGLIIAINFFQVIFGHYYLRHILQLGLQIRVATSSLVYRKALKLSKSSQVETTVGQMVNLLSNDVSRFDNATVQFHCLWYCPIQALIVMYLCYINLGPTAMAGVVILVLFVPFQMWMARKVSVFRHKTALWTDERIHLINEIISGITVIKMYTWEKPFAKLVEINRRKELQQIQNISYIRAVFGSLSLFMNRCAIFLCLLTFVLIGNVPTAQYVYTLTAFYNLLQYAFTVLFPQGITQFAEVSISIKRLHTFFMYEEVEKQIHTAVKLNEENVDSINSMEINLKNVSVKWSNSQLGNTLNDINLMVDSNQLVAIVGPVGSGKTTLLHSILKEVPIAEGSRIISGSISYSSQEPWLFAASIRQNIIFGQEFNEKKYQEVVRVCALERDFALFSFGDKTVAGERGVALSGGQKARINLARAIYKDADIYLLDDPLSAVDAHVGRHIFDKCITEYLRNKCVVLVTHQLHYLCNVQHIYVLENGRIQASGTYDELQKSDQGFTKLLTKHKEEQKKNDEENKKKQNMEGISKSNENLEQPIVKIENMQSGKISWQVYKGYILAGGHWCKILFLLSGFALSQISASLSDYFQMFWINLEEERYKQDHPIINKSSSFNISTSREMILLSPNNTYLSEKSCLIIYSILIAFTVIITLTRSFVFYRFSIKASLRLHNNMFGKIIYATMNFFNTNPSGRILNRFSKDIGSIDERLPLILLDTVQIAFIVLAVSLIIGSLNPWMYLPTVIILVIFYLLKIVYLRTSRDIKRLEATARSPIYSHLNASLQGLTTIRAFGAQEILKKEFDNYQNLHSCTWFTAVCTARSFGMWLDMHCIAYVALVTLSFLFFRTGEKAIINELFGGNVGLAITQALSLTNVFQWGMRQWSELENQMTSVERVKEYADIVPERDEGTTDPPKNWPENGNIRFENLCLNYESTEPYILKNLSFAINSKERVGIVGRTGAGKSSIIAALFRLTNTTGKIIIDTIETKSVSLKRLRSSISIIPQEPVMFSGTLRKNLDPFDEYTDEILWNALKDVELKSVVTHLPQGLESKMVEGGSNFSVGQRQLVCLARAIVKNNKILILDEATANVDPQTDAVIQMTIRRKFANCTVLTIAHRLHTVLDSDKILVMDAGRVVEYGHPYELLQKIDGKFYNLVTQTSKTMLADLVS